MFVITIACTDCSLETAHTWETSSESFLDYFPLLFVRLSCSWKGYSPNPCSLRVNYHYHSSLLLLLTIRLLATRSTRDARIFWLLSLSGTVGLFPLLFDPRSILTEVFLTATYTVMITYGMQQVMGGWRLTWADCIAAMMVGLGAGMYCFCPIVLPYALEVSVDM